MKEIPFIEIFEDWPEHLKVVSELANAKLKEMDFEDDDSKKLKLINDVKNLFSGYFITSNYKSENERIVMNILYLSLQRQFEKWENSMNAGNIIDLAFKTKAQWGLFIRLLINQNILPDNNNTKIAECFHPLTGLIGKPSQLRKAIPTNEKIMNEANGEDIEAVEYALKKIIANIGKLK